MAELELNTGNHPFAAVQHIFKANDIRGLLAEVTPELARAVGYAVVQSTGAKKVIVGRDMRETSPALLEAVAEGVNAAGAQAIIIGMCTTSLFNYSVVSVEEAQAGIMVTASHNPSQYNGIKMARHDGLPISGAEIFSLLAEAPAIEPETLASGTTQNESRDMVEGYVRHFMEVAGLKEGDCAGMKVAVDFGNGMGSVTVKRALELLGAQTFYLYEEPDARFPNHEANPAKWDTLRDLQSLIAREKVDLGVALDGDADRIGFLTGEGHILRGDQTLAVLAGILAPQGKAKQVIVAPNFGWGALEAIKQTGAELIWERIGRGFVVKKMRETGAALGGELSSHFFFADTRELEAVDFALMLMLKGIKESGKTFVQLTEHVRRFVNSAEINLHVEDKAGAIARVKAELANEATSVSELDGVRCEFERDWWFILRPSNTEPLLRLTVEAKDQSLMDEKVAMMRELIGGVQEH